MMLRARNAALVSIALLMSAASTAFVACSTTTISAPNTGGDAGDAATGVAYASSPCGTCVASACAAPIATCNADPTCASHLTCVDACAITPAGDVDPTCEAACPAPTGSAGTSAQAALTTCRKQGAGAACAECGSTDGGADGSTACLPGPALTKTCAPSNRTDVCGKCQYDKCCDLATSVYGTGPAAAFSDCFDACDGKDIACVTACETSHAAGVTIYTEFVACLQVKCLGTGECPSTAACPTCQYQKCGCELANCNTDVGCWHVSQCVARCKDPACAAACQAAAPAASAQLYDSYTTCTVQKCVTSCN